MVLSASRDGASTASHGTPTKVSHQCLSVSLSPVNYLKGSKNNRLGMSRVYSTFEKKH